MRAVIVALFLGMLTSLSAQAQTKVVFLNPGASNEFFWVGFSDFMQAAAQSLDLDLTVLYAEREPQVSLDQVRTLLASESLPDYLILTNENYIAPEVLRLASGSSMKLFILHNQLTAEQQAFTGHARERYPNWIGTAISNNEEAGYLTGKALLELNRPAVQDLVAIAGSRQTPVSQERVQGLLRALQNFPEATLRQVVHGDWRHDRAEAQTMQLIKRYPDVRLIWAASDEMAFGAIAAMQQKGLRAGRDFHVAAMNNSERVLKGRISGEVSVLAAGHFTLGGFSLVMVADHAKGLDFKEAGGVSQRFNLFQLLSQQEAGALLERVKARDYAIDFKAYSASSPNFTGRYQFSLAPLLTP